MHAIGLNCWRSRADKLSRGLCQLRGRMEWVVAPGKVLQQIRWTNGPSSQLGTHT